MHCFTGEAFHHHRHPKQSCSCHPQRSSSSWIFIGITSPHVIQDLPFGEKTITLSPTLSVCSSQSPCKTIPCICRGILFYSSQPQNSVKHSFCLFSFYKKVLTRSRLYQFSRSSGLSRSYRCSKMLERPPNRNDLGLRAARTPHVY